MSPFLLYEGQVIFMTDAFEYDFEVESKPEEIKEKKPFSFKKELFEWLEILIVAIILLVVLFSFVFKVVTISGRSMQDTLFDGEKIIISDIGYTPQQGDIVVISRNANNISNNKSSNTPIIKRVIATEGQVVDINFESGHVYVDGVKMEEEYVRTPTNLRGDIEFPVVVNEGCIFVLGDNRNDSTDSRNSSIGNNGMIDTRHVLGKALFRIFPFNGFGGLY